MNRDPHAVRLRQAGFAPLPRGWVPEAFAARVVAQVEAHRSEVEKIVAQPPRPRGRPRKEMGK